MGMLEMKILLFLTITCATSRGESSPGNFSDISTVWPSSVSSAASSNHSHSPTTTQSLVEVESKVEKSPNMEGLIEEDSSTVSQHEEDLILDGVQRMLDYLVYRRIWILLFIFLLLHMAWYDFQPFRILLPARKRSKTSLAEMPLMTDGERYYQPGEYIRPLERIEVSFATCLMLKSFNTHQAVWLRSKNPIQPEMMHKTLEILTRQIPILQFCLGLKRFCFWFKRMNTFEVNFKYVEGDPMVEYHKSLVTDHDAWRGPLWNAKLVKCTTIDNHNEDEFVYMLMFNVHHTITDATTNMMLCREAVRILESLQANIPIKETIEPISRTIPVQSCFSKVLTAQILIKLFVDGLLQLIVKPTICPPLFTNHETKVVMDELTAEETCALIRTCKSERVTVNSAVVVASSFAFRQAQKQIGGVVSKRICVNQAVNLRKYCTDFKTTHGCYISILPTPSVMELESSPNFWEQTHKMQSFMKEKMDNQFALKFSYIMSKLVSFNLLSYYRPLVLTRDQITWNYTTTNMNRIDEHLPEPTEGSTIEIFDVLRSLSGGYNQFPFCLTFQTFRSKLKFSLDTFTNHVTEAYQKAFFETFMANIRQIAATGNLQV